MKLPALTDGGSDVRQCFAAGSVPVTGCMSEGISILKRQLNTRTLYLGSSFPRKRESIKNKGLLIPALSSQRTLNLYKKSCHFIGYRSRGGPFYGPGFGKNLKTCRSMDSVLLGSSPVLGIGNSITLRDRASVT